MTKNAIYLGECDDKTNARDPFVFYKDGFFYHLFSKKDQLWLKKSSKLEELKDAEPISVYSGDGYKEIWAPELHVIDGKCFIYVAMDDGDNFNHRMYVLENGSSDPVKPYKNHGMIVENPERWAIDGSILYYENEMYFIWAGWEGNENVKQNIYIQKMKDPYTLVGERAMISTPTYEWEKRGAVEGKLPLINEGPFAIYGKNHLYIVYSAAGSWCNDYCLGLLTFKGGDILDPKNWVKTEKPILSKTEKALGPGHASFFEDSRNGKRYVTYHLFNKDCSEGWFKTHAMVQEYKMVDDCPVLDEPVNYFNN